MQAQLEVRKKELDGQTMFIADNIHQINQKLSEKIFENSIINVQQQSDTLRRRLAELRRREDLRKKLEPNHNQEREEQLHQLQLLEKERDDSNKLVEAKKKLSEERRSQLDSLLEKLKTVSERLTSMTESGNNTIDYTSNAEKIVFDETIDQQLKDKFIQGKQQLHQLRERHAEEDCLASTLERSMEEMHRNTQLMNAKLSEMACSKCTLNMALN